MEKPKIVILNPRDKETEVLYPESLTDEIRKDYETLKIPVEA